MKKKMMAVILALSMVLTGLSGISFADTGEKAVETAETANVVSEEKTETPETTDTDIPEGYEKVTYLATVDENGKVLETPVEKTVLAKVIKPTAGQNPDMDWPTDEKTGAYRFTEDGWYLITGEYKTARPIHIEAKVHFILADGCSLSVSSDAFYSDDAAIRVNDMDNASLTIWAQSTGDTCGKITATAGAGAAIGGANGQAGHDITINGGNITATSNNGGAGIGGGRNSACDRIVLNAGTVRAAGNNGGAGIGTGLVENSDSISIYNFPCGVTINGGNITATGNGSSAASIGAGIGGGLNAFAYGVVINGGEINAVTDGYSSAIGGGYFRSSNYYSQYTDVTINGGKVSATQNGYGYAIGGGSSNRDAVSGDTNNHVVRIKINGGDITAKAGLAVTLGGRVIDNCSDFYQSMLSVKPSGALYMKLQSPFDGTLQVGMRIEVKSNVSVRDQWNNGRVLSTAKINSGVVSKRFYKTENNVVDNNLYRGITEITTLTFDAGIQVSYTDTENDKHTMQAYRFSGYHEGSFTYSGKGMHLFENNGTSSGHGNYYITESQTIDYQLEVSGDINLILMDGVTLTIDPSAGSGIYVHDDSSLTIWGGEKGTGTIVAAGKNGGAGIRVGATGSLTVNGGMIRANGGYNAAGIGGANGEAGCNITVNGGYVYAAGGENGAGIGGGNGGNASNILITGGTVSSYGVDLDTWSNGLEYDEEIDAYIEWVDLPEFGAGIGAGLNGIADGITITGGRVMAVGSFSAAIGGGGQIERNYRVSVDARNITISGGYVIVSLLGGGAGIGGGTNCSAENIRIQGGRFEANKEFSDMVIYVTEKDIPTSSYGDNVGKGYGAWRACSGIEINDLMELRGFTAAEDYYEWDAYAERWGYDKNILPFFENEKEAAVTDSDVVKSYELHITYPVIKYYDPIKNGGGYVEDYAEIVNENTRFDRVGYTTYLVSSDVTMDEDLVIYNSGAGQTYFTLVLADDASLTVPSLSYKGRTDTFNECIIHLYSTVSDADSSDIPENTGELNLCSGESGYALHYGDRNDKQYGDDMDIWQKGGTVNVIPASDADESQKVTLPYTKGTVVTIESLGALQAGTGLEQYNEDLGSFGLNILGSDAIDGTVYAFNRWVVDEKSVPGVICIKPEYITAHTHSKDTTVWVPQATDSPDTIKMVCNHVDEDGTQCVHSFELKIRPWLDDFYPVYKGVGAETAEVVIRNKIGEDIYYSFSLDDISYAKQAEDGTFEDMTDKPQATGTYKASFTIDGVTAYTIYTIVPAELDPEAPVLKAGALYTYSGSAQDVLEKTGSVAFGNIYYAFGDSNVTPPEDSEFTLSNHYLTDVGDYYLWYKVVGWSKNYVSQAPVVLDKQLRMQPLDISEYELAVADFVNPVYNGQAQYPSFTLKTIVNQRYVELVYGKDYEFAAGVTPLTNAGTSCQIWIRFIGNYAQNTNKNLQMDFTVQKADYDLTEFQKTFTDTSVVYDGESHTLVGSESLDIGADGVPVTVSYTGSSETEPGEYVYTAALNSTSGNYNTLSDKKISAKLTIEKATLTDVSVKQKGNIIYIGEPLTAEVETSAVSVNDQPVTFTYSLEEDGVYTETVPAITEAGDHLIFYKAGAPCHYDSTGVFMVSVKQLEMSTLNPGVTVEDIPDVGYTGLPVQPDVVVSRGDKVLTQGTNYEVEYSDNTEIGTATAYVYVTNVTSRIEKQFRIVKGTPVLETEPDVGVLTVGKALSDVAIQGAKASVEGTFAWKNPELTPSLDDSDSTDYTVVFTPSDTDHYNGFEFTVKVKVFSGTEIVSAPTAKNIVAGKTLSMSNLKGGQANVPGTFAWKEPDTVCNASDVKTAEYTVVFTPDDTEHYCTAEISVPVKAINASYIDVYINGEISELSFAEAINSCGKNDIIRLYRDVTASDYVKLKSGLTLNLNGHDLVCADMFYAAGRVIDTAEEDPAKKGHIITESLVVEEGQSSYAPVYNETGYSFFLKDNFSVAQAGKVKYTSLQKAVESADGEVVQLISREDAEGKVKVLYDTVTIPESCDVTIDLNGVELCGGTDGTALTNNGHLTVTDSVGTGKVTGQYALSLKAGSDTKICGGNYYGSSSDYIMESRAVLKIYGGTFSDEVPSDYCGDGYAPSDSEEDRYTVTYNYLVITTTSRAGTEKRVALLSGGGAFVSGAEVTLKAYPKEGYSFAEWQKNGQKVSETAEFTFNVSESADYVAVYSKTVTE